MLILTCKTITPKLVSNPNIRYIEPDFTYLHKIKKSFSPVGDHSPSMFLEFLYPPM